LEESVGPRSQFSFKPQAVNVSREGRGGEGRRGEERGGEERGGEERGGERNPITTPIPLVLPDDLEIQEATGGQRHSLVREALHHLPILCQGCRKKSPQAILTILEKQPPWFLPFLPSFLLPSSLLPSQE
jgi:hypothetical protein